MRFARFRIACLRSSDTQGIGEAAQRRGRSQYFSPAWKAHQPGVSWVGIGEQIVDKHRRHFLVVVEVG